MENELEPIPHPDPRPSQTVQEPLSSRSATSVMPEDAEALRKNLERNKLEVEKLTRRNAALGEYVTRAEKTEREVAKAYDDYKNAFAKFQTAKRDTDQTNDSDNREAIERIGPHQGAVDTAVRAVDQTITDVQKRVADLRQRKAAIEAKLDEAQNSLVAAQAELRSSLSYQAELTAGLKGVADVQAKIQKVKDPARAAEFYFYTTELRKKLSQVNVRTPDELNAELSVNLTAVERAISDVVKLKGDLIDVGVDLDLAQRQLADLENNREPQILAKIRPYNQPATRSPEASATEPSKLNAPAE